MTAQVHCFVIRDERREGVRHEETEMDRQCVSHFLQATREIERQWNQDTGDNQSEGQSEGMDSEDIQRDMKLNVHFNL